jgi:hypothetical protein
MLSVVRPLGLGIYLTPPRKTSVVLNQEKGFDVFTQNDDNPKIGITLSFSGSAFSSPEPKKGKRKLDQATTDKKAKDLNASLLSSTNLPNKRIKPFDEEIEGSISISASGFNSATNASPQVIRFVTKTGEKPSGITPGFIGTSPTKNRSYVIKKGYQILPPDQKQSIKKVSDTIYEFIFSPLFNLVLNKQSPIVKLHAEDQEINIASMIMPFVSLRSDKSTVPDNFELLIFLSMFLGDDDWWSENIGKDGRIDFGRASVLQISDPKLFVFILEFLFQHRYAKAGFKLDYQKLVEAAEMLKQYSAENFIDIAKQRAEILRNEMQEIDISEIQFFKRNIVNYVSEYSQYLACLITCAFASWDDYEKHMVTYITQQFKMLPDIIHVIQERSKEINFNDITTSLDQAEALPTQVLTSPITLNLLPTSGHNTQVSQAPGVLSLPRSSRNLMASSAFQSTKTTSLFAQPLIMKAKELSFEELICPCDYQETSSPRSIQSSTNVSF